METLENKILTGINQEAFENDFNHIQEVIFKAFLGTKDAFQALGIEPDEKMIKNAVSGQISVVEQELFKQARQDAHNLISQPAKDNLFASVRKSLSWFKDEIRKASRDIRSDLIQYVTLNKEGNPIISQKSERELKRLHSQFIHSQRGKEVFETSNEVVDKLRNLCQLIHQTNPNWDIDKIIDHFISVDLKTNEPVLCKGINFDWFGNQSVG